MKLDFDIMVAMHTGELTPAEAFAAQARRQAPPAPVYGGPGWYAVRSPAGRYWPVYVDSAETWRAFDPTARPGARFATRAGCERACAAWTG